MNGGRYVSIERYEWTVSHMNSWVDRWRNGLVDGWMDDRHSNKPIKEIIFKNLGLD